MPYIPKSQREAIDPALDGLIRAIRRATIRTGTAFNPKEADGAVNYAVTRMLQELVAYRESYLTIERAVGCLECCKSELYRRLASPYEDRKSIENGDAYDVRKG